MAPDIFFPEDIGKLLNKKVVVFLGDSNVRALYKDLVCLTQKRILITRSDLKAKMEKSYLGDRLVYHGQLCNGRDYKEEREFDTNHMKGSYNFYFLTRIYYKYAQAVFEMVQKKEPDVLIMNSCLWDVTRWGPTGVEQYKKNLLKAMRKLREMLPNCLIIWLTCAPITADMNGGFLVKQLEFLKYSLRFHVMEANYYAHKVAAETGVDVLDVHHSLRMFVHLRAEDGIHWQPPAVRLVTNLILTHISKAFGEPLPHRFPPATKENLPEGTVNPASISNWVNPPPPQPKQKKNRRRNNRRTPYDRHTALRQDAIFPRAFQDNCVQPFAFGQQNLPQRRSYTGWQYVHGSF